MHQLLEMSWWFSYIGAVAPWWLFMVAASIAALPICLRCFRGMADRGAGLSIGVGTILVVYAAFFLSLGWFGSGTRETVLRLLALALATGVGGAVSLGAARGWIGAPRALGGFAIAGIVAFFGLVHLPHGPLSIYASLLLVAAASAASWWGDFAGLRRALRTGPVPLLAAHAIFLVALLFFANVRSYIPYAAFELRLWQAEKFGNYTHLNSIMHSRTMPPADVWFNGEPINYYYGGHLLTATVAKATGTSPRIAFNLGIATIFALTMAMGFTFVLSLVHLTTRKVRLWRGIPWHSGMAWGVLGALAIGMFGNLDAWRQLLTREVDFGVRFRWEQAERRRAEDWKIAHGIAPAAANQAIGNTQMAPPFQRADMLASELRRIANYAVPLKDEIERLAKSVESAIDRSRAVQGQDSDAQRMGLEAEIGRILAEEGRVPLERQNGVNAQELEERLFDLGRAGKFDLIPAELRAIPEKHRDPAPALERLAAESRRRMDAAVANPKLAELAAFLADPSNEKAVGRVTGMDRTDAEEGFRSALEAKSFSRLGETLAMWYANAEKAKPGDPLEGKFAALVAESLSPFRFDALDIVRAEWGDVPKIGGRAPDADGLRFTWENATFLDFWASSRAIKGAPPGSRDAGTITEFPFFSAILGDHHPHHAAIPYTLAALCACLSLLRKSSRRRRTDLAFFRDCWPDMLAMSFFIGAVFAVNIWDSVVLAPLYGLAVIVARAGVSAATGWRWVGFGGFLLLLAMVISVPANSVPGSVPLFLNFKAFLAAFGLLAMLQPAALFFLRRHLSLPLFLAFAAAGTLLVMAGAGPGAALRDGALFAAIAAVAALWTLRQPNAAHCWWYSAGATYALVGGASLAVILPFKAFFQSPLRPAVPLLDNATPPLLSRELTTATGAFWDTFWRAMPINPFPAQLRTDLRDFIVHWGIFLIPILGFAAARFVRAARGREPGFTFMVAMTALATMAVAINYLDYWAGAISIGLAVFCVYYALRFRHAAEGPAWVFLAAAFFWTWFSEALHFDDDMAGNLERYNSLFKIYYPIWAMFAGGMVVALREMFARFRFHDRTPREALLSPEVWMFLAVGGGLAPWLAMNAFGAAAAGWVCRLFWLPAGLCIAAMALSRLPLFCRAGMAAASALSRAVANWPALLAAGAVCFLGLYYPLGATVTRTREFFTWPKARDGFMRDEIRTVYTDRTLDALAHLDAFRAHRADHAAIEWMEENLPADAIIAERPGEHAYEAKGRMATGTGLRTIIGWRHHEHQWRGRAIPATPSMKEKAVALRTLLLDHEKALGRGPRPEGAEGVPLASLNEIFPEAFPGLDPETLAKLAIPAEDEHKLRMAPAGARLAYLRALVPSASLEDLLKMRRGIAKRDYDMNFVFECFFRAATEIYTAPDRDRALKILRFFGIRYVVVGSLEYEKYGPAIDARFRDWGFKQLFDSGAQGKKRLNPMANKDGGADKPTYVFEVPGAGA